MEITVSKRIMLVGLLVVLMVMFVTLLLPRLTKRSIAQTVGFDSGRNAARAGVEAFYGVDYQTGPDVWAARLCALSTQRVCEYYQNTVAKFIWPAFISHQTIVTVEAANPILIMDQPSNGDDIKQTQVWQLTVTLSIPWPQGDGRTTFPVHALVMREETGWKFERLLLNEEISKFSGGEL